MSNAEHFMWTEKYRPQTLAECVLPSALKAQMQSFVAQGDLPNMILQGGSGMGKTTTAMAMCRELDITPLFINGSSESGIDTLRTTITEFAASLGLDGQRRMVLIDEADYLNPNSTQPALRALMEEYAKNCGFILTCNYGNRIIPALHSRASSFTFSIPPEEKKKLQAQTFKRLMTIFAAEQVQADEKLVTELVKRFWPDMRKMLVESQRATVGGVLTPSVLGQQASIQYDAYFTALQARDYKAARTWIGEHPDLDAPRFYRAVFDWLHDRAENQQLPKQALPGLVVLLADYQYRHTMALDAHVHLAAFSLEVMNAMQAR